MNQSDQQGTSAENQSMFSYCLWSIVEPYTCPSKNIIHSEITALSVGTFWVFHFEILYSLTSVLTSRHQLLNISRKLHYVSTSLCTVYFYDKNITSHQSFKTFNQSEKNKRVLLQQNIINYFLSECFTHKLLLDIIHYYVHMTTSSKMYSNYFTMRKCHTISTFVS